MTDEVEPPAPAKNDDGTISFSLEGDSTETLEIVLLGQMFTRFGRLLYAIGKEVGEPRVRWALLSVTVNDDKTVKWTFSPYRATRKRKAKATP